MPPAPALAMIAASVARMLSSTFTPCALYFSASLRACTRVCVACAARPRAPDLAAPIAATACKPAIAYIVPPGYMLILLPRAHFVIDTQQRHLQRHRLADGDLTVISIT